MQMWTNQYILDADDFNFFLSHFWAHTFMVKSFECHVFTL